MSFLPVVHRELLVAARLPGGAWFRFLVALAGFALFSVLLATPIGAQPATLSEILFQVLSGLVFLYALLSGVLHTADAVGMEKREGTLGLLFLTDLRGYDVVLGKLVSHSVRAAQGVLAVLPILALPIIFGGVSGAQVFRMVETLLSTLFFSLSLGLLWSVLAPDFRSAMAGTVIVLGVLGALYGLGWAVWQVPGKTGWEIQQFSPVAAFRWARAEPWQTPLMHDWWRTSLHWLWAGGALSLVIASIAISRIRERVLPTRPPEAPAAETAATGLVGYRQYEWADLLARCPYAWFQRVQRPVPLTFHLVFWTLVAVALGLLVASIGLSTHLARGNALYALLGVLWVLHQFVKVQVALAATRGMSEDRQSGALELLVVAGQGRDEIVRGHREALWRQYLTPVSLLLVLQFLPILRMGLPGLPPVNDLLEILVMLAAGAGFLLFDLDALIRTGLRQALKDPGPQVAFRSAYLRIQLPGWIGSVPLAVVLLAAGLGIQILAFLLVWVLVCAYALYRVNKRTRIDLEHGFQQLATGMKFDTSDWELRDDFRRAAMVQVRGTQRGLMW
jgi:hypothetical protein